MNLIAATRTGHAAPPAAPDLAVGTPDFSLWGTGVAIKIELPAPWPDHVALVTAVLEGISHECSDARWPAPLLT